MPASRALNNSVVVACGNGSCGASMPSAAQIGSHPSPGDHSSNRSAGTPARTSALCRR
jgi:hypothetical protein